MDQTNQIGTHFEPIIVLILATFMTNEKMCAHLMGLKQGWLLMFSVKVVRCLGLIKAWNAA